MPLPLIPIAIGLFGLFAAKKGYDAYSDNAEASSLNQEAKDIFKKGQRSLKTARTQCTNELEALGRQKFEIWDRQLGRFVSLMGPMRNVELIGALEIDQLGTNAFSRAELARMKELSSLAAEVVGAGPAAIGTGALVGMASYGGATMLATASTGTAISTLGGVAATNATLAWFGGGSLAAGGLGVAGGMAVLGGIVAAPVLAVGGFVLAAKARENLAAAKSHHAQAEMAAAEMRAAASVVRGIRKVACQFRDVLAGLDERTTQVLDGFEMVIEHHGADYAKLAEADRRKVHLAVAFAQGLKAVLDAPLLTKSGALTKSYPKALEHGRSLLGAEDVTARGGVLALTVGAAATKAAEKTDLRSGGSAVFSAKRLKKERERLGLSADNYGKLIGVSGLSIYNWEQGKARPSENNIAALTTIMGIGKRDVAMRLEASRK